MGGNREGTKPFPDTNEAFRMNGRSDVLAKNGMVATSQPLATVAGLRVLQDGGNAIDAAVAAAAVLDVVEPFSTGSGGDAFALVHEAGARAPRAFNGSGRSGSLASLDDLILKGWKTIPLVGGASVTVPGAVSLWCRLAMNFGNLEMSRILEPAINYARNGFPVSPIISRDWKFLVSRLHNEEAKRVFSIQGRGPEVGEIMRNKDLASVFEQIAEKGPDAFYKGDIADAIAKTVQQHGGFLTSKDISNHRTVETEPINVSYRGVDVYEHGPNGQGFAALEMLQMMEEFDFASLKPYDADRFHISIEAKKLAYADLLQHNADPDFYSVPLHTLLSKDYASKRAAMIHTEETMPLPSTGLRLGEDTVYLATADGDGNAVSFINSLYTGFGSGLVVPGTGIKLQSRGNLFSLDPAHPNCYAAGKLPFHTIIPAALYREGGFWGVLGIMGGSHQAQAHAQVISNLVDYRMKPQKAIDFPRFHHDQLTNDVGLSSGVPRKSRDSLRKKGHEIVTKSKSAYGGGQAILWHIDAWIAGSDYRKDGMAAGF
ncbi:MAG: gamma-glutamyltransferase [Candidatus Thorarchaeota archaeon]|nr:gamma-glutamyltransferase [Candidatus Thorarchaeota archaeon]